MQFVGVVDVDGFPGSEEVDGAQAFAVAVAGAFYAAEGEMDFGADGGGVDVGDSGFEVAHGGEGAVHVFGVERRGQAVVDGVGDLNGLLEGVEFDEADYGAEDLFAGDAHGGSDAAQYCGLEEVAVGVSSLSQRMAAGE